MIETICRECGARYQVGTDHVCSSLHLLIKPRGAAVRKDSPSRSAEGGRARLSAKKQDELPTVVVTDTRVSQLINGEPRKSHFDKVAYQRDYMRKRRAAAKEGK